VPTSEHDPAFDEWFAQLCTSSGLTQGSHHGRIDYRAAGKIVANAEDDGAVTLKVPLEEQHALLHQHPDLVRLPAGWSKYGWTTVRLQSLERTHVRELLASAIETVTSARQPDR
jgi:hypothetical protein